MPEVEREPQSQNADPVNGGTNNGGQRNRRTPNRTPQTVVCEHERAALGSRYCPQCGEEMAPLPVGAIRELVQQELRQHGVIREDGRPVAADPDAELRRLFQDYRDAAEEKGAGNLFGPAAPMFKTFRAFREAEPDARRKELERVGIKPSSTSVGAPAGQKNSSRFVR